MFARLAAFVALLPAIAFATLTITKPDGSGWVGNTTQECVWTWSATDPSFSIELGNPGVTTGLLQNGPIAIANNIQPSTGSLQILLPVVPPANGYWVKFVKVDDINTVYATSATFAISNNPTGSSVSLTSVSTKTSTGPTTGKSSTSTNGTSTTGKSTSTSTTTKLESLTTTSNTSPITTLPVTPLSSSSSTPTTSKKNAASSQVDVMGWNVASVFALGSVILGSLLVA